MTGYLTTTNMKGTLVLFFGICVMANNATIPTKFRTSEICTAEGSDSILIEHEECTKYYICSQGQPVALDCPRHPTLYYNDDIKACDWPDNVDCGSRIVKDQSEFEEKEPKEIKKPKLEDIYDDPSKAPEICAVEGSNGILVAHEECNKFYTCSTQVPVANKCGINPVLYYNPKLKACDWPENVDCGSRTVDAEGNEEIEDVEDVEEDKYEQFEDNRPYEEKAIEACDVDDSDGELLPHGHCDKFYMCSEGRPIPFQCPEDPLLFYNSLLKYCDWADKVSCGDRQLPTTAL